MKNKIKIENLKGTFDYTNKEQQLRDYISSTLQTTFKSYGYTPLETPIICYYDLLTLKYEKDDEILKEVYKFRDQGNRNLALRYDLTVPFAKYVAMQKNLQLPFKRYEIGNVFRDGPVKLGRNRQFIQCDVDVVGLQGQLVEAELILMYISVFKKLNIPIVINYNSRNLMQGLIEELSINNLDVGAVIKLLDKVDKLSKEALEEEFLNINVSLKKQEQLLEWFSYDLDRLENVFYTTLNKTLAKGLQELRNLANLFTYLNISEYTKFTPTLARGQEYYTGNVFEVYALNSKITSSIGSGGRYDNLISDWINDKTQYPSVGISFGLNVIYEVLKEREELQSSFIDIYVVPMDNKLDALSISEKLRTFGYNVEIELRKTKLKKSFQYANKKQIPFVVIIGNQELQQGCIKLRNMTTGSEYNIDLDALERMKEYTV